MHDVVKKPWGFEYIVYENEQVAMKLLHINAGERTSLHCHPSKSTGLVVVKGEAKINFISDDKILKAPAKQMIRRGLFHQTIAITDVMLLEIETPIDQDDLVRLTDSYGREGMGYEKENIAHSKRLKIEEPDLLKNNIYYVGECMVAVFSISSPTVLETKCLDDDIIIFLRGGLVKTIENRTHLVTQPGDVGLVKVVNRVAKEMDGFANDTLVMSVRKGNFNESM